MYGGQVRCPVHKKANNARWYEANREQILARQARWYEANREKVLARMVRYGASEAGHRTWLRGHDRRADRRVQQRIAALPLVLQETF